LRAVTILPPSRAGSVTERADEVAAGRAADFLVRGEEMRHRQRDVAAFLDDRAQRGQRDMGAALHVVDAGAEGAAALDAEGHARERAHRMHRVEMRHHEDALLRRIAPGAAQDEMRAEAVAAWDDLGARTESLRLGGDRLHQGADLLRRVGRRLMLDPGADAGEQRLRGEFGHAGNPLVSR
jgi:hypothetical protein